MKAVILTGCTSGLGLELHNNLINKNNIYNFFLGRNLSRVEKNSKSSYYEVDFIKINDFSFLSNDIELKRIKYKEINLVLNAGVIEPIGQIGNLDKNNIIKAINVNLLSVMLLVNEIVFFCKKYKIKLKILNISTGASNYPISGWSCYCTTKAAVKMYLKVLNEENDLVEVINFDPGVMNTKMQHIIRRASLDEMPSVNTFIQYRDDNKLKMVKDVVDQLLKILSLS